MFVTHGCVECNSNTRPFAVCFPTPCFPRIHEWENTSHLAIGSPYLDWLLCMAEVRVATSKKFPGGRWQRLWRHRYAVNHDATFVLWSVLWSTYQHWWRNFLKVGKCMSKHYGKYFSLSDLLWQWTQYQYCYLNIFERNSKRKNGVPGPQKKVGARPLRPPVAPPCLLIKWEKIMINFEKRKLLHDYYQSHILFH